MARTDRRNRQLTKRKPQKKVTFLVEGPTEKDYLHDLLPQVAALCAQSRTIWHPQSNPRDDLARRLE